MDSNEDLIEMEVYAYYKSVKTSSHGLRTFRYNTEFRSINGQGKPIGLIVMLNPGGAEPESDEIIEKLETEEFETLEPVLTKQDNTMKKVKKLIGVLYQNNERKLPEKFTIHIENLFNLKEKNSDTAKRLAKNIKEYNDLMFKERPLKNKYDFVFFAWGNTNINNERQLMLQNKYKNAISVHVKKVSYPIHPLYMNTEHFIDASMGKLF